MKDATIVYEPQQRRKVGWIKIWGILFTDIIHSKELVWQLFKRDFLMAYKRSFLGMAWIFISPVVGIASWVFMNATGILAPGDVGIPYPAYVLISSSIWGLFMGFYSSAQGTLGAGGGFIMQVKFPHEVLLVKQTAQHLANFLLGFVLNIIILIAFGVIPSWKIVFFPVVIIPMFLLAAGIGLVTSVIDVVAPDIVKGFNLVFGLLMYITPIIYSTNVSNTTLRAIMEYNPLTYLVGNARDLILFGSFSHPDRFIYSSIAAVIIFMISWKMFYVSESKAIERMI